MTSQTTTEIVDGKEYYRKIPVPTIPAFPVLSWRGFFPLVSGKIPSLYHSKSVQYFTAARYALYEAFQQIGVKDGDEILVPAYHCKAMIYPILDAGCTPVFYKINKDLSTNIKDLDKLINLKSKAIIAVNYFGFVQNIHEVRKCADRHGLKLVEDCAHSLFGSHDNKTVGTVGDYAIGSTKKFFAVEQGGILTSRGELSQKIPSKGTSLKSEIRFIYNSLEKALDYGRLWFFRPIFYLVEKIRSTESKENMPARVALSPSTNPGQDDYLSEKRDHRPPMLSMLLEKITSPHRLYVKRRENYMFLAAALKDIPGLELALPELQPGIVPYMLPVVIKNLPEIFPIIENQAIPFQRFGQFLWDGAERCPVSIKYAATLLQLPCHQELTTAELQSIADRLHEIMDKPK